MSLFSKLLGGVAKIAGGALGGPFGAALGQGVAGLIQGRSDKKAAQAALAAGPGGIDFKKLRDDASAAGFNPLTALQATGAAGYDRPSMSSPFGGGTIASAMASPVGSALSAFSGAYFDQLNERNRLKLSRDSLDFEQRSAERQAFGSVVTRSSSKATGLAPTAISVVSPWGDPMSLSADQAARLGVKSGDRLMAGEMAEVIGEIPGEGSSIYWSDKILDSVGLGGAKIITGSGSPRKPAKVPNRRDAYLGATGGAW